MRAVPAKHCHLHAHITMFSGNSRLILSRSQDGEERPFKMRTALSVVSLRHIARCSWARKVADDTLPSIVMQAHQVMQQF